MDSLDSFQQRVCAISLAVTLSFIALNTVLSALSFVRRFKVLYAVVTRIGSPFSLLSSCLMMSSQIEGDEIIMPSIILALFRASPFVVHGASFAEVT